MLARARWRDALCVAVLTAALFGAAQQAQAAGKSQAPAACSQFAITDGASTPLQPVALPPALKCTAQMSHGFPIPDRACTPGAINPTLTADVLKNPAFTTKCVRNNTTTEAQKNQTYAWYDTPHPEHNSGATQTCELDHLISLELGGADTLDNIWPQCGPGGVPVSKEYFKEKDGVENYLAKQVRDGAMDLAEAQKGISVDWTQYLDAAKAACSGSRCR